jgi:hypothetical protein
MLKPLRPLPLALLIHGRHGTSEYKQSLIVVGFRVAEADGGSDGLSKASCSGPTSSCSAMTLNPSDDD